MAKRSASPSATRSPPPARSSAMAPLSLPSLPLSLVSLVLEFAVLSFSQELRPTRRGLSGKFLSDVALVAKSWYPVVDELLARYRRDTMEITLKFGTRVEVLAIRQQVQLRGRAVRDLRIRMGRSDGSRFETGVSWWMEDRELPWDVLFAQMPGLKRLDLRCMPLESRHVPILLQMASKFCLQIEMLVLPRKKVMTMMVNCAAVRKMMEVLKPAMERWHLKGKCGGLKQLTVPTREEEDRFRTSTDFINDVIEFCPNVEYLDGYNHAIDEMNDVTCEEKWMISLETWKKFNKTCTNLREFHWAVVPFADPFFRVFGDYLKPKLKKLALTSNLSWDLAEYFKMDGSIGHSIEKPGYGFLANDITSLLRGCPGLTEIEIAIDQDKRDGALAALLDPDVFGDKFWEAVIRLCPLLQSVYLHDCSAYGGSRVVRPINTFTDRGLLMLADHTRLTSIELSAVCCSGNGAFEYLQRVYQTNGFGGGNRSLVISLAGPSNHDVALPHPFYNELVALLKRLADTSEGELGAKSCRHKASLNVFNPHSSSVDKDWSISYMLELKPLMEKVASEHPSLDFHVVICRDSEDSFRRIDNLELDWCAGSMQGEMFIEDEFVADADNNNSDSDEDDLPFDDEDDGAPLEDWHRAMLHDDEEIVFAHEQDDDDDEI